MMIGIGMALTLPRGGGTAFSPLTLFSSGEQGIWLDPSDLSSMWQDAAGTTPVTAAGQPVGRILDKSGRGNHAHQPVASCRPTLGRHPVGGRRNFLVYTEEFENAAWGATGGGAIGSRRKDVTSPLGVENDAWRIVFSAGSTIKGIGQNIFGNWNTGAVASASVWLKLPSGTATVGLNAQGSTNVGNLSCSLTNQWQEFRLNGQSVGGLARWFIVNNIPTNEIHIWRPQLELGSEAAPYQRVDSAYDVTEAGKSDCWYLETDGVDDFLVTPTITPGTDKAQVFAGVRKLSEALGALVESGKNFNPRGVGIFSQEGAYSLQGHNGFGFMGYSSSVIAASASSVLSMGYDIAGNGSREAEALFSRINGATNRAKAAGPWAEGTGNFGANVLYIGGRGGTTLPFKGNLYSLITRFGPNLDEATIAKTEAWLNTKTGAY